LFGLIRWRAPSAGRSLALARSLFGPLEQFLTEINTDVLLPASSSTAARFDEFNQADGSVEVQQMRRRAHVYCNHDGAKFDTRRRGGKVDGKTVATDYNDRQFAQLYFTRLAALRPLVIASAQAKWPELASSYVRIVDIPEDKDVYLVGTMYKDMGLKPSILNEYSKKAGEVSSRSKQERFTQAGDQAVLEDEGGRVALVFGDEAEVGRCVTGTIVGVRGRVLENGEFRVAEVCFAGLAENYDGSERLQGAMDVDAGDGASDKKYVAIVAGFGCGASQEGDSGSAMLALQLMMDTCSGILGTEATQRLASGITRVVIAGGLLAAKAAHLTQPTSYALIKEQAQALDPLQDLDAMLSELCETVDVDVMPGVADPTNYSLPQQPLHRCLLPQSSSLSTFSRCTNPHAFEVDGVHFLGTSGQNVDDIMMYSTYDSPAEILERMLFWRHLIPTAPDSLSTYPFVDEDPFVLDKTPDVLFAGGCGERVETRLVASDGVRCRVVSVPEFSKRKVLVLVDVTSKDLDVQTIAFD